MRLFCAFLFVILSLFTVGKVNATPVAKLLGKEVLLEEISPDEQILASYAKNTKTSKEQALLQYRHAALTELVLNTVIEHYSEQIKITEDDIWIERFLSRFAKLEESAAQEDIEYWQTLAKIQIRQWRFDKYLYEKYKGSVVFRNNHPQFPVEAYGRLLSDYQENGQLRFYDDKLGALFWQAFQPPFRLEIAPANVDFSTPWWAK